MKPLTSGNEKAQSAYSFPLLAKTWQAMFYHIYGIHLKAVDHLRYIFANAKKGNIAERKNVLLQLNHQCKVSQQCREFKG